MARKKEQPKALFALKQDFYESLDNASQQAIMLIQAIEMALRAGKIPEPAAGIIKERVAAFRASIISPDEVE